MRKVIHAAMTVVAGAVVVLALAAAPASAAPPAPGAPAAPAAAPHSGSAQQQCPAPARGHAACMAFRRTDVSHPKGVQATPSGYGPADLLSAYNLAGGGAGETVAITIAFENTHLESDLATYRQQFGLPPCTTANGCFRKIDQRGGSDYPIPDENWAGESDLDVQMVSAICPQCHILVVEADDNSDTNLFVAIDKAVESGAQFVSNSWGGPADPDSALQFDTHFEHPGVAFTVSSGDFGFGLEYPAFSQHVTAVGGTSLIRSTTARGWTETAWGGAGSGCADKEPKPSFQHDPLCPHRMESDVSAVADPQTGVAVYDNGWQVFGGTSVAAPIIAGVYALAGPASPDKPANSYPYARTSDLNDVTSGRNGFCAPNDYFCTAGPGYDGPTGLGTPNGTAAFTFGPHGQVTGTVRDAVTSDPVPGATVTVGESTATTDGQGRYALSAPLGDSAVSVAKFGYRTATSSVDITGDGQHVTLDVPLTALTRASISGTLTDGSGHGWPLYGTVAVHGQPETLVHTDPATGAYRLSVPTGDGYTIDATPAYAGYQPVSRDVTVGETDQTVDLAAAVDSAACDAPGYAVHVDPVLEQHFDGAAMPDGWTQIESGMTWAFDDPTGLGNRTGGSGGFASIDGTTGPGGFQASALISSAFDLSGLDHPVLTLHSAHHVHNGSFVQILADFDGGNYGLSFDSAEQQGAQSFDLSVLPVEIGLKVEFDYVDFGGDWYQIDDVTVGNRGCVPVAGGLITGHVTDRNTGAALARPTVTGPNGSSGMLSTPDDADQGGYLYTMFAPAGARSVTASAPDGYQPVSRDVAVSADQVTRADFALPAGQLVAGSSGLAATVTLGAKTTTSFTVRNTGTAPATVSLHGSPSDTVPATSTGAPRITGPKVSPVQSKAAFRTQAGSAAPARSAASPSASPNTPPWTSSADYPAFVSDNAAATAPDGTVYSVGGRSGGLLKAGWALTPSSGTWSRLPDMPEPRYEPRAAFLLGKLYVVGGLDLGGNPLASLDVYDPATRTWSTGPAMPHPASSVGIGVVDGQMYAVGGCANSATCGMRDVQVFDPATGAWSAAPDYPVASSWLGCGGIDGRLYCAGGANDDGYLSAGYSYDPAANAWTPLAALPASLWGASVAAQGGRLLLSGGVLAGSISNAGFAYDPSTSTWSALPNANEASYAAAGACGMYRIGGRVDPAGDLSALTEVLPGYGGCSGNGAAAWLSASPATATLQPGASVTVTVTMDAAAPDVPQPGVYAAGFTGGEDTPYPAIHVPVAMTVLPPPGWGELSGTVTGTACSGVTAPLPGVTVSITGSLQQLTVRTDASGRYDAWLDARNGPLTVFAALDGWAPQSKTVKIAKSKNTTLNLRLTPDHSCG